MNMNKRADVIIEIIRENNGASIRELASALNVTEMTIRRDVKELKEIGVVKNISGAILLTVEDEKFYSSMLPKSRKVNLAVKRQK